MPLIQVTDETILADLVAILNANFLYVEGIAGGTAKHVANFSVVTGQHTISHNLNSSDICVSIWDEAGSLVSADVQILTANSIRVTFEAAFSGRVVVLA